MLIDNMLIVPLNTAKIIFYIFPFRDAGRSVNIHRSRPDLIYIMSRLFISVWLEHQSNTECTCEKFKHFWTAISEYVALFYSIINEHCNT